MSDTTEIAGTLAGLKALDEETIAALQAQLDEEIRLNAMGSEREARLMARLAECERERDEYRAGMLSQGTATAKVEAELAETQRLLEVQLAVRDKQEAEVKRLTEKANRAVEERDRQYEADGLRVLELQTLNDGLRAELAALREACLSAIDTLTNGELNVKGRAVAALRDALGR